MNSRLPDEPKPMGASELEAGAVEGLLGPNPFVGLRPQDILETIRTVCHASLQQPTVILEQQAQLAHELYLVLTAASQRQPAPGDKRFTGLEWTANPIYRMWLQSYLAWRGSLDDLIGKLALNRMSKERAKFVVALLTDAVAPTNILLGNPAAVKK